MNSENFTNEPSSGEEQYSSFEKQYFDGSRYTISKGSSFDDFETEYRNFCLETYTESDEDIINKYKYAKSQTQKKKRKLIPVIFFILATAGIALMSVYSFIFISNILNNKDTYNEKITIEGQKKEDTEIKFQLTATKEWEKADLSSNEDASLILSGKNRNKGYLVICEGKDELGDDVTLEDYFDAVKSENTELEAGIEEESIKDITLISGYEAKQLKVNINHNDQDLKYIITLLETDKSFYQLIGWTMENIYDESEKDFVEMTESFMEL
ncbi:MAG TPA: hypothetical protein VIO64_11375 [Pseudobacteroides sp.]|uniref:hypothetical protein n=1 Tax=Pseudobacteroides sp. TaxID=1968840 RepID=UPI002F95267D